MLQLSKRIPTKSPRSATVSAAPPCWNSRATAPISRRGELSRRARHAQSRGRQEIKASILVLHGADDPVVPDAEVLAFEKEMRDAKVDWEFVAYGNTVHSFTNWNLPENNPGPASYNKKADQRSWKAMQDFFQECFR